MVTARLMRCWLATAATLTVTAALLAPPAAARPGPELSTDDPPTHDTSAGTGDTGNTGGTSDTGNTGGTSDTGNTGGTGDTGNTGDGSGDPIDVGDVVDPDPAEPGPVEPGPVGHSGAATYAMVSTQDAVAPHSLASVEGTASVDTVTAVVAVSQCGSGNAVGCAGAVAGAVEVISNIVEDSIEDSQQKKPEPSRPQPRPRAQAEVL